MKTFNNTISKQILKQSVNNLYESGLPYGLTTDSKNLDDIFRIDRGKLVTITGIPNMGKSEFLDFLCVQYNKIHKLKTVYFSPENQPIELHFSKLISKFTNQTFSNKIDKNEFDKTVDYITDNFFFLNYENIFNLESVLTETENIVNNNENVGILVIDSFNKLEAQKDFNVTETDYISKILDSLERFAKRLNLIVFLVAHPRKMQKDSSGNYSIPSPYDINGSANFFNKSDYCITVHRDYSENNTIIKIDKVKFKNYGVVGETILGYDLKSGNYFDIEQSGNYFDIEQNYTYVPKNFIIPESKENNNTIDYLSTEISFFNDIKDVIPKSSTLKEILFSEKFKGQRNKIEILRNELDYEKRKALKSNLLNYSVSCTFEGKRAKENIKEINNLVCIDIDKKDNLQIINKVPNILKSIDNVLFSSKSCGGDGYFCIIPIQDKNNFLGHWNSLEKDFKKLGIEIDKQCKDVSRVRYFSIDNDYYLNTNCTIYNRISNVSKSNDKNTNKSILNENKAFKTDNKIDLQSKDTYQKIIKIINDCKINDINLTENYSNRFTVCMSLISEFGENGRELIHEFCKLSKKYDKAKTDENFDNLLERYEGNNDYTINSIYHIYNSLHQLN